MFDFKSAPGSDAKAVLEALGRSLAIIEFEPAGKILNANENFCSAVGYGLAEIKGQHHSMFVAPDYAAGAEYRAFWTKLAQGEYDAQEYKRIAKGGREIWIQASYNPVKNAKGAVVKVVKVAALTTEAKLRNAEFESKLNAISRVQGVIEFTPTGEVLTANENFLTLMGYRLDEVRGQHHRLFVEPAYGQSIEYQDFWRKLNGGEYVSTSFKRIAKGGREVWIQASYNPVFDMSRKVVKVVKFATDITDLTEIGAGLAQLAENNLDYRIDRTFIPAFEKLRIDYNMAHENLRTTMLQIADSTSAIQSGTQDISAAADDLSRRTEQQAASLEETAAALDEITATVKKSAAGANHARQVVATADEDAKKSAVVVRQAVEAMDAIAKSAQQISQIIGVIDEIAFQTNLLALNAGVEAARAGDAGRGFAVVASEVRALAQRSAEAAKEIKGLISASSAQVDHGVKLVAETGKSLERIMGQVAEINGVVADIAAGAKEQSGGLEEVNIAINQMDQVTQQNAAMVEESTAASHALSQETAQLSRLIDQFQIGHADAGRDRHDVAMRRDGARSQPHALAKLRAPASAARPSAKLVTSTSRPESAKSLRMSRPAPRTAASGGGADDAGSWDEF